MLKGARMAPRSTQRIESLQHAMGLLLEVATREQLSEVLLPACEGIFDARPAALWLLDEAPAGLEPPAPVPQALRSGDVVVEGTRAAVPLAAHGRTLGAIHLELVDRPALDREEVALLRAIGHAAAGALVRVLDVTAEREAERQKLRTAARDVAFMQATSVIRWGLDASGMSPEDSPSWRAFTGMGFEDQKVEPERLAAVHPDDRARVRAAWSHALETKSLYQCELRVRRYDGAYVWILSRFVPVLDERGEVVEWVGADVDISKRKRAEEEREATLRFAEQFIGILSHDLRNPIAAVQMGAEMLKRRLGSAPEARPFVERIASSARRMGNMVAQLLDLTRVRLGTGLTVERQAMNLTPVVLAVIDELRLVHPGRAIACDCESAVEGAWDGDRLAQVVSNLVGNALQHGDAARPVEVRLANTHSGAVFEVQSYGSPIAPDLLPRLFDPYRQGGIRGGKSSGLGLGLFITQQIVLAHGGRIDVRSTAAEGTRFTVTLPRG
jgi:PAS domain S-box-containing protein